MRIAERRSLAGDNVLGGEEGDWLEGRWLLLLCDRRGWPGRALARSTGLRCGPLALLLLLLRRWRIVRLLLPDRPVHLLNALRIGVGRPGGRRSRRAIRRRPGKLLLLLLLLRIYRGRWLLVVGLGLSLAKGWSRMLLLLLLRRCVCSSRQRERRPGRGSARVSERRSGKGSTEGDPATHSPETLRQGPGKILQLLTLLLLVHSKGSNGTRGLLVRGVSSEGRQGRPSPGRARRRRVARIPCRAWSRATTRPDLHRAAEMTASSSSTYLLPALENAPGAPAFLLQVTDLGPASTLLWVGTSSAHQPQPTAGRRLAGEWVCGMPSASVRTLPLTVTGRLR